MHTNRTEFLGVTFDNLTMPELLSAVQRASSESKFRFVVTPNVDHVVRLHSETDQGRILGEAYQAADYVVCDSRVLAALAKLGGCDLPVVPGSDLTARIFEEVIAAGDRIAVVGGDRQMIRALEKLAPNVEFLLHVPPMGLLQNHAARTAAAIFVSEARARFTFICVGSPQQEVIAAEIAILGASGGVGFCVGAALDFITDRQKRAPRPLRRVGLEWAHRLWSNPRRLWRRYLIDGPKIFLIFLRRRRNSP